MLCLVSSADVLEFVCMYVCMYVITITGSLYFLLVQFRSGVPNELSAGTADGVND